MRIEFSQSPGVPGWWCCSSLLEQLVDKISWLVERVVFERFARRIKRFWTFEQGASESMVDPSVQPES